MTKLAANWSILLMSQLMKGKFFLRPEIAMGMGAQVASILNRNGDQHQRELRRMEINTFNGNGKSRSFFFDDEDEDDQDDEDHSVYGQVPQGSVARIPIKGTMLKYGTQADVFQVKLDQVIKKNGGLQATIAKLTSAEEVDPIREIGKLIPRKADAPVVMRVDMRKRHYAKVSEFFKTGVLGC